MICIIVLLGDLSVAEEGDEAGEGQPKQQDRRHNSGKSLKILIFFIPILSRLPVKSDCLRKKTYLKHVTM